MDEIKALNKSLDRVKNQMLRIIITSKSAKNPQYRKVLEDEFSALQAQADFIILVRKSIEKDLQIEI